MTDNDAVTVRIRRPARVAADDRGRSVWTDTIVTAELELVSTLELKQLLEASDEDGRRAIESVIDTVVADESEGVLARDPATGLFEIISDADLQTFLRENEQLPKTCRPADATPESAGNTGAADEELSLVSTQVLRKIRHRDDEKPQQPKKDPAGGFDPYNSG